MTLYYIEDRLEVRDQELQELEQLTVDFEELEAPVEQGRDIRGSEGYEELLDAVTQIMESASS